MKTSPAIAFDRLQRRARTAESTVSLQYLTEIHDLHEQWINGIRASETDQHDPIMPIFTIDADQSATDIYVEYDRCLTEIEELASQ